MHCERSAQGNIIRHVPQEFSCLAIEHNRNVTCEITGHGKCRIGLEVPCIYTFNAEKKMIKKLHHKLRGIAD